MKFVKMHGCGNDYIFVEEETIGECNRPELARKISDRKSGVGSDGLIIICHSESAELRMEMYNSDGSRGKMCGNGIRCLCKYAFERKITIKTKFEVETDSGLKNVKLECDEKKVIGVSVNMGTFSVEKRKIKGIPRVITCVDVGNPHAVIFVDDVCKTKVAETGRMLEYNLAFPERVNVEFVQIIDKGHLKMRVWERGSGETLSCGTGACASLIAGYVNGLCDNDVSVVMPGGTLQVSYNSDEESVYLFGDANEVFSGDYLYEGLAGE